jgi:hypothetical protein
MPLARWYVILFALGTSASIASFWIFMLMGDRLSGLIADRRVARAHVAAELTSAALLFAGGFARLSGDGRVSFALMGLGMGTLVYALIGSPAMYPNNPRMRAAFYVGWLFTLPALVLLLLDA